jgi:GNAT superfamily N-acetyltransferase
LIPEGGDSRVFLKNKTTRNQINRLKRNGEITFERLYSRAAIELVLPELIANYDLRHLAVHGIAPFLADPKKRRFYVELLGKPGLLHVTILRVGNTVAAAHIGVLSGSTLHLGITSQNPWLASSSPGKLLMHYLVELMDREGLRTLDLTPGDDPYKDRFANHEDRVHSLTVHAARETRADVVRRLLLAERKRAASHLRPLVRLFSKRGHKLTAFKLSRVLPSAYTRIRRWLYSRSDLRVYSALRADSVAGVTVEDDLGLRQDSAGDFLTLVADGHPSEDVRVLVASVLGRIAQGHHVYTAIQDGMLAHYGWFAERQERSFLSEVGIEFQFPANSAVLYDFYTHPKFRGRGLYSRSVKRMLADALAVADTREVFIFALADNIPSRIVIERTGFSYRGSLIRTVVLGRVHRGSSGLLGYLDFETPVSRS